MFGDNMKEIREGKRLKQEEIAEKTGISVTTLSRYENNRRTPQISELTKIAAALGCTVSDLLGEGNSEQIPPHSVEWQIPSEELMRIPLFSDEVSACCGYGLEMMDDARIEEWMYVPKGQLGSIDKTRPPFAIKSDGDSMEGAGIDWNTKLAINPAVEPVRGDVVVFEYFGRRMARYYVPTLHGVDFIPAAPSYPTLHLTHEDMSPEYGNYRFIGVVRALVRPPKRYE